MCQYFSRAAQGFTIKIAVHTEIAKIAIHTQIAKITIHTEIANGSSAHLHLFRIANGTKLSVQIVYYS